VGGYGGVFSEGDSPYNLETFLHDNPQYRALNVQETGVKNPEERASACPSKPELLDWYKTALAWLLEEIPELEGISFRMNDYALCGCDECVERSPGTGDRVVADMAHLLLPLVEYAVSKKPAVRAMVECPPAECDRWRTFESLVSFPDETLFCWELPRDDWQKARSLLVPGFALGLPGRKNILRLDSQGGADTGRTSLIYDVIHEAARTALEAGFRGLGISAEVSPLNVSNEMNYLAFSEFCYSPDTGLDGFCEETLAELVGGIEAFKKFISFARDFKDLDKERVLAEVDEKRRQFDGVIARRWDWLYNYIDLDGELEL
jgi:hypothetical protein